MSGQPPSLAVRMAKGAGWIVAWRMCTRVLGIVNTVVLVRLLVPADFGLVALATSLSQTLEGLLAVGVSEALIREKEASNALYNTGFTINLIRSGFIALCILAGAVPAGSFFGDPQLTDILLVLAALTLLNGFENIGIIEFRRDLAFEREFIILVIPRIAGIMTSIAGAILFANYWALIVSIVVARLLRLILTYAMHPYRPGITLSAWRRIVAFSFWTWACSTAVMIQERADSIVIGRVLGPAKVGLYAVGWEIGSLASTELLEPLATAMFAGFSAGWREGADVAQGFFKAISMTLMLTLPIGVGISLVAAPVVSLMFGPRWLDAVFLVQVFALLGVTKVIPYFGATLLGTHGMLNIQFRIVIVSLALRVGLLLILVPLYGLAGAVAAATITAAAVEVMFLVVTFRLFHLRTTDLFRAIWRSILAAAAMALVVYLEGIGWAPPRAGTLEMISDLAIASVSGAIVYIGVLLGGWWLCGRPTGAETAFLGIAQGTWNHTAGALLRRRVA